MQVSSGDTKSILLSSIKRLRSLVGTNSWHGIDNDKIQTFNELGVFTSSSLNIEQYDVHNTMHSVKHFLLRISLPKKENVM